MPSAFPCTSCGAQLKIIKPPAAGVRIKCPKCGAAVAVPADEPKLVATRRAEPPVRQAEPADEELVVDRPARTRTESTARSRAENRRFKKTKPAKSNAMLIGVGVGVGVLVIGVGITLAVIFWPKDKAETQLAQARENAPTSPRPTPPVRPEGKRTPPSNPTPPPADGGNKPAEAGKPPGDSLASNPPANPPTTPPPAPREPDPPPREDKPAAEEPAKPKDPPPAAPPPGDAKPKEGFEIGDLAPDIQGADIDGKKFKLSDYRGKVVVLDFWGHW